MLRSRHPHSGHGASFENDEAIFHVSHADSQGFLSTFGCFRPQSVLLVVSRPTDPNTDCNGKYALDAAILAGCEVGHPMFDLIRRYNGRRKLV